MVGAGGSAAGTCLIKHAAPPARIGL